MVIEEHVDLGVRFEKYEINIKIQEMDLDWTRLIQSDLDGNSLQPFQNRFVVSEIVTIVENISKQTKEKFKILISDWSINLTIERLIF